MKKWNKAVILIVLILTFVLTNVSFNNSENTNKTSRIVDRVPLNILSYKAKEIEVPEKLFEIISPDEISLRTYKDDNREIYFAVVTSNDKDDIHAPEICYKLQGFQFKETSVVDISENFTISKVNTLRLDKEYTFLFWYTDFEKIYKDRFAFIINYTMDKLLNRQNKQYGIVITYVEAPYYNELKEFTAELNKFLLKPLD